MKAREEMFRRRMEQRRRELGLSQSALADRLREQGLPFHQQTIQRIEAGDRNVRLDEAFVIAESLNAELAWMLEADRDMAPAVGRSAVNSYRRTAGALLSDLMPYWARWADATATLGSLIDRTPPEDMTAHHVWIAAWLAKGELVHGSIRDLIRALAAIAGDSEHLERVEAVLKPPVNSEADLPIAYTHIQKEERPAALATMAPDELIQHLNRMLEHPIDYEWPEKSEQ